MNKNDFAPLPPMGWNSYDYYDTTVDEARIRANADYMAAHLKEYGWEYIVVDIQWYAHGAGSRREQFQYIPFSRLEMDRYARLLPDPERFPSSAGGAGFKPLADYIHGLGLKFGIHIMRGIPRQAAHAHAPIRFGRPDVPAGDVSQPAGAAFLPADAVRHLVEDTSLSIDTTSIPVAATHHPLGDTFLPTADAFLSAGDTHRAAEDTILSSDDAFFPTAAPLPVTAADIADPSSICDWNSDMYGVRDCAEGQAYYDSLLELYASWGVDYIKCDDICNTHMYPHNPYSARHEIEMLARAIQRCGRPVVLSLSPGPALIEQANHYKTYANLWRITDDLWDRWDDILQMFVRCELWQDHVERGCYPDCDMLPLGRIGKGFGSGQERATKLTRDEQRTLMTLWCIFGSPLMLGAEMTMLDEWTLSLLTNRDILAMRAPEYRPRQIFRTAEEAAWLARNEKTGETYVALFNLSGTCRPVSVTEDDLQRFGRVSGTAACTELWTGESFPAPGAVLLPHGCCALRMNRNG